MKQQLYLIGEIARLTGIKPHRIAYAISSGQVPEPKLRINNKRIFQRCDLENVREYFRKTRAKKGAL